MWTVQVAGEPVKPAPATAVTTSTQRVRIPLIKTAEGDLDYPVVIKYGGQIATPKWLSRVEFPLIHTLNINVELSQVRLRLPEAYDWFNFDGTLGRVQSESDLQAGWLSYRTRQLTELSQLLGGKGGSASDYTKARALNNLSSLETTIQQSNKFFSQGETVSEEFRKQLDSNYAALQSAQQQAIQVQQRQTVEGRGNRDLLNDLYGSQSNGRSFNALGDLGLNFSTPPEIAKDTVAKAETINQQNAWLSQNKLDNKPADEVTRLQIEGKVQSAKPQSQMPQEPLSRPLARRSTGNEAANAEKQMALPPPGHGNDSQAARYGRRLQEQNANGSRFSNQSMNNQPFGDLAPSFLPPQSGDEGGMGGGMGGFGGGLGSSMAQSAPATPSQTANTLATQNQFGNNMAPVLSGETASAAFMASLDVDLPVRGREYFFTTPRGQVELSVQGIATKFYQRLYTILAVLVIAAAVWVSYLFCERLTQTRWGTTAIFSGLILFGIISLVQGYLPIYGGLALLAAVVLVVVRLEMRAPQTT